MTPAVDYLKRKKLPFSIHSYEADPSADSYGLEAADALGLEPKQVFKTLIVALNNNQYAVGIIPVSHQLSLKRMAKALSVKKAAMAEGDDVERMTGYVLGGVSPLGQKKRLSTILDSQAKLQMTIFISGGKRGLEIEIDPLILARCLNANFADVSV